MDSRFRSRPLLLAAAIAASLALTVLLVIAGRGTTHAGIVPGEYSLSTEITPVQADVGAQFTVAVAVRHNEPPYQAVQWDINYDQTIVSVISMTKDDAAPGSCTSRNDNGDRVLLGCLDIGGPIVTYSGIAFNVVFQCIAEGNAAMPFQNVTGPFIRTFVNNSAFNLPIHIHEDALFCGTPPPTSTPTASNTPLPPTFTPSPTATRTRTPSPTPSPSRTATATATIAVPPDQDQWRHVPFDPAAFASGAQLLEAVDLNMEMQINTGWNVVDSTIVTELPDEHLLYGIQRSTLGPRRADLTDDDFIDLQDALVVVASFGSIISNESFNQILVDPAAHPNGAALLAAIDALLEPEIAGDWNAVDSAVVDLDGSPRIVLSLQRRNIPPGPDLNGDNLVDLTDAMVVLGLFNTTLPPAVNVPPPPGPDRFRTMIFDPATFASDAAMQAHINLVMETEIAAGWDPIDSSLLTLDGMPKLVYSLQRANRKHRADQTNDNFVDLQDALALLNGFGQQTPNIFQQLPVDHTGHPNANSLIVAVDPLIEGQQSVGFGVADSTELALDPGNRLLFSLQLKTIPPSRDLNGDQFVDLGDVLIALNLFNTVP